MTALVDVEGLTARGRGEPGLAFGPITFALDEGEALAVTGPHGAGKSLLLACLAGIATRDVKSTRFVRPDHIAMIFQRDALDDGRSALDNVLVGCGDVEKARAALERVGLGEHVDKRPRALSGGMRKRVGIARALASSPTLILADEPTAGLDPSTAREVLDALFSSTQAAVIIATTDVDVVLPRAPRTLFLEHGRVLFLGPTPALAADARTSSFAPQEIVEAAWL